MAEKNEKVTHQNIYAALAAFQSETPDVVKSKRFGKETDPKTFMYATLDDMVKAVSPITSKNGLSFTWENVKEGELVCSLYHETYMHGTEVIKIEPDKTTATQEAEVLTKAVEKNVIRSTPVKVNRSGNMQAVGSDSTYARKYTLCEVLGITSDEDNDAPISEESAKNAVKTVFVSFKDKIMNGTHKEVEDRAKIIEEELKRIGDKKAPKLGLTKSQYEELWGVVDERLAELNDTQETGKEDKSVNVG